MHRTILFLLALFLPASIYADEINKFSNNLEMENKLELWVSQHQPNQSPETVSRITTHLLFHSAKNDIPLEILVGLITVESRFNLKAVSPHGAKGLTQVMPKYHKSKINGRNLFDPAVNIEVGSLVYKDCLSKYKGNIRSALGCYNGSVGKQAQHYQKIVLDQSNKFLRYRLS